MQVDSIHVLLVTAYTSAVFQCGGDRQMHPLRMSTPSATWLRKALVLYGLGIFSTSQRKAGHTAWSVIGALIELESTSNSCMSLGKGPKDP